MYLDRLRAEGTRGPEAGCAWLLQAGWDELQCSGVCYYRILSTPRDRADTYARPPAGTKGEEVSARGPVPAFQAHGSEEVGEESWLETKLDSVPF